MNTETNGNIRILCSIRLQNKKRQQVLLAEIAEPTSEVIYLPRAPEPVRDWGSGVVVRIDGQLHKKVVWSCNWQSTFNLALDYVRRFIPEGQEREWCDEEGLESWCVLPKLVPISWGYELYERISRMSDEAEREFVTAIERRRLASDARSERESE